MRSGDRHPLALESEASALQLRPGERSRLIERLMDSLHGEEDGGRWIDVRADRAWLAEIQRRSVEIDRGEVTLTDHEDVIARFVAEFGRPAAEGP